MRRGTTSALALAAGVAVSVAVASCGGGAKTAPTGTTTAPAKPPERPVVIRVNGKRRVVTLSKVNLGYCRKRTDVCAAIRGANFRRLSPLGKRAALRARSQKRAREAAEAAAAREAARREAIRRRQQEAPPPPPPQPAPQPPQHGTTTG